MHASRFPVNHVAIAIEFFAHDQETQSLVLLNSISSHSQSFIKQGKWTSFYGLKKCKSEFIEERLAPNERISGFRIA